MSRNKREGRYMGKLFGHHQRHVAYNSRSVGYLDVQLWYWGCNEHDANLRILEALAPKLHPQY